MDLRWPPPRRIIHLLMKHYTSRPAGRSGPMPARHNTPSGRGRFGQSGIAGRHSAFDRQRPNCGPIRAARRCNRGCACPGLCFLATSPVDDAASCRTRRAMPTVASATLHALDSRRLHRRRQPRAGGAAGRRPARRGQPDRPRFARRRPPAVLRPITRQGRPGRQPPSRGRARAGCRPGDRGPARLWPGDRPRGDAARHG